MIGALLGLVTGLFTMGVELAVSFVMAIPSTIAWNALAPIYGKGALPDRWLHLPFWHVVGGFILACVAGRVIQWLTPKVVSTQQTTQTGGKRGN
jgi:ABC-type dipeptide/oligopeptide/nickel transport system permease subunit